MKKSRLIFAMLLMLCSMQVMADAVSLSVPSQVMTGDEFTVSISLENAEENYCAFVMNIVAPQGLSFVQEKNEDDDMEYAVAYNADRKKSDHIIATNMLADNTLRVAGYSASNKVYKGTSGEFITVKLKANATGNRRLALTSVVFTDTNGKDYALPDVATEVNVAMAEGGVDFQANKFYYLYNVGSGMYYCAGNDWGTKASVGTEPMLVKFTQYQNEQDVYLFNGMFRNTWQLSFFENQNSVYVDRNQQPDYGWSIVKVGDYYRLSASASTSINPNYSSTAYPDMYLGLDVTDNANNTALSPFLAEGDGHYIDWMLMAVENSPMTDWTSTNKDDSSTGSKVWVFSNDDAGILRFDWQVSSESGCDFLRVVLDGVQIVEASGEQQGSYEEILNAGSHILSVTYTKDGSVSNGSDQAMVKNLAYGNIDNIIENYISQVLAAIENNQFLNTVLRDEALAYIEQVRNGQYDKDNASGVIEQLVDYATRLAYLHLDIDVATPGSMGNAILGKVENFSDVQSIRLSGTLNSDDIYQLRYVLTNLIEIDLANLNWTEIPSEQFRDKNLLQRIILPNNLVTIGYSAFYNCQNLKEVTFPTTLQSIGNSAFYNTRSLGAVVLPEGLTSLGENAFQSSYLTSLVLPSTLKTVSYYAFGDCDYLTQVQFNGQESIENYAFYSCDRLASLNLPATLKTIGDHAFHYARQLTQVEIPEGVTTIGYYAFGSCENLTNVILPSTVQSISYSFRDCSKLTQITCHNIVPPTTDNQNITGVAGRDLYVPMVAANVYKQTPGWHDFNIHGIDYLPESVVVNRSYMLYWPEEVSTDYKPSVRVENTGRLTVSGNTTLSMSRFTMVYDENLDYQHNYGNRGSNATAISASLINDATMRADDVLIDLWIRANRWTFFSLPFDAKVSAIGEQFPGTPFVIRKYDSKARSQGDLSNTWVNMTADSTLHAGEGYIIQAPNRDNNYYDGFWFISEQTSNKNRLFANDNVEIELAEYQSEFPQNRSWNFIGNPYPCYYDTRAIDVTAPITVWNNYNNNYQAFSPVDDQLILRPGEAFFIQRPVDQASITFLKEGRQTDYTVRDANYFAATRQSDRSAERSVFNVVLSNGEQNDRTRFVINPQAQMGYEMGCDASKFISTDAAVQLYTVEQGVRYAINERPFSTGEVTLGAMFANKGTYTLSLTSGVQNELWLIDRLTGTEVLFSGNEAGYTFQTEAGTYDNRFAIRIGNGDVTGISTVAGNKAETEYYNLNGVCVEQPRKGIYVSKGKKVVVK